MVSRISASQLPSRPKLETEKQSAQHTGSARIQEVRLQAKGPRMDPRFKQEEWVWQREKEGNWPQCRPEPQQPKSRGSGSVCEGDVWVWVCEWSKFYTDGLWGVGMGVWVCLCGWVCECLNVSLCKNRCECLCLRWVWACQHQEYVRVTCVCECIRMYVWVCLHVCLGRWCISIWVCVCEDECVNMFLHEHEIMWMRMSGCVSSLELLQSITDWAA